MKKYLKKSQGFTLTELLAVITILAILAILLIPTVTNKINSARESLYDAEVDNIIDASKMWLADNMKNYEDDEVIEVTIDELVKGGYIEDIINPKTDEEFSKESKVIITYNKKYSYEFVEA
jgi:type IV pilus assembly protein PilA